MKVLERRVVGSLTCQRYHLAYQKGGVGGCKAHVFQPWDVADPHMAASQVIHRLKGYTSRVLRKEYPHLIRLPTLWTRPFLVSTASMVSSKTVEQYIAAQKTRD